VSAITIRLDAPAEVIAVIEAFQTLGDRPARIDTTDGGVTICVDLADTWDTGDDTDVLEHPDTPAVAADEPEPPVVRRLSIAIDPPPAATVEIAILDTLAAQPRRLFTTVDLARELPGWAESTVATTVRAMTRDGLVARPDRGVYQHKATAAHDAARARAADAAFGGDR
jgi:hypothetical protein